MSIPSKEDEFDMFYFHGSLPDMDAEKMLERDGDFLIHSKYIPGNVHDRLYLLVRKEDLCERIEIERLLEGFRLAKTQKIFTNFRTLIKYYYKNGLITPKSSFSLKRPIARSRYQLVHRDIRFQKRIGRGAYGTVYKGTLIKNHIPVAIKRIASDGKTDATLTDMIREARVMQMFNHKNIVRFYGFIVNKAPYLLVMELCPNGSLEDKLRKEGEQVSIERRVSYSLQASRGIEYLHHKSCIHRDIATRNCLLNNETVKVADFGMCRTTPLYKVDLSKPQNVRWLSPEVWKTGETNLTTDIYAFGLMLWEMFIIPYVTPYSKWKAAEVKRRVMAGYRMPTPTGMPPKIAVLMRNCWDQNSCARPKARDLRRRLEDIYKDYTDNALSSASLAQSFSQVGVLDT